MAESFTSPSRTINLIDLPNGSIYKIGGAFFIKLAQDKQFCITYMLRDTRRFSHYYIWPHNLIFKPE